MKIKWHSSAAYRIAFAYTGAVAVGLVLVGVAIYWAMHIAFTDQLDRIIAQESHSLVAEYRQEGRAGLLAGINERYSSKTPASLYYALFRADGRRIAGALNTGRPRLGTHDIQFVDPELRRASKLDYARAYAVDLASNERLVVAADREWIERGDETVIVVFGVALMLVIVVGATAAFAFGSYLRTRLQSISQGAQMIISGDLRQRIPLSSRRDEFDELAKTLNAMFDRIEELVENLRQVSNDIAHDMRTPLSRLRNSLERGLSGESPGARSATLEDAIGQVDAVLSLFSSLLRIAEVESGETRRYFTLVDLSALATELAESYAPAVEDSDQTLFWLVEEGLTVLGDAELLAQATINLLENAHRHTPPGTIIRLTAVSADGVAKLQIFDNGPGVPTADLSQITKRFTRLDRSRKTAGHGLGLSLASAVAKLHGGLLRLQSAQPGLCATIELPVNPAPASPLKLASTRGDYPREMPQTSNLMV
jgi:signal transduction histidine kinase